MKLPKIPQPKPCPVCYTPMHLGKTKRWYCPTHGEQQKP